ncbi:hypothetical protein K435DRAFT_625522, partial [Dendrothele bispora CBS 962.96]
NWLRDPSLVKSSARESVRCPGFPDSEWNNLFKGKPVDFDVLLTSTYTLDLNNKQSFKLGELELNFEGVSKAPARKVRTHGEWVICWGMYEEAILFTMPWRKKELQEYFRHITGYFKSYLDTSYHSNIVNYDRAVRLKVSMHR